INWPTRVTSSSATTIDQIFTSTTATGVSCVIDNCWSDHRTVLFELDNPPPVELNTLFYYKRKFSDKSIQDLYISLSKENWDHQNISIKMDDKTISDPALVASTFNTFFANVASETIKKIHPTVLDTDITSTQNRTQFFLYPFIEEEFYELLSRRLKNKK